MTEATDPSQGTTVNASTLPSSASKLGTDAEGDTHYYSAYYGRLWVVRDGADTLTMDLDGANLATWVDHIDARVGWAELHYSRDGIAQTLAAAVGVAD